MGVNLNITLYVKREDIHLFFKILTGEDLSIRIYNGKVTNYELLEVTVSYYQYQYIEHLITFV